MSCQQNNLVPNTAIAFDISPCADELLQLQLDNTFNLDLIYIMFGGYLYIGYLVAGKFMYRLIYISVVFFNPEKEHTYIGGIVLVAIVLLISCVSGWLLVWILITNYYVLDANVYIYDEPTGFEDICMPWRLCFLVFLILKWFGCSTLLCLTLSTIVPQCVFSAISICKRISRRKFKRLHLENYGT